MIRTLNACARSPTCQVGYSAAALGQVRDFQPEQRKHPLHAVPILIDDVSGKLALLFELHFPAGSKVKLSSVACGRRGAG